MQPARFRPAMRTGRTPFGRILGQDPHPLKAGRYPRVKSRHGATSGADDDRDLTRGAAVCSQFRPPRLLQFGLLRAGGRQHATKRALMHNRALHDSLAAFIQEAAWQLAEEVSGGAEIPFELDATPTRSAPLYCYRPLTGRFIAQRAGMLGRLPSYAPARRGLESLPDLFPYLTRRGRRAAAHEQADAALQAFLAAVWEDVTDFVFDDARFESAYKELEDAAYSGCELSVVITPVEGLVIESDEVPLGDGLSLVRAAALETAPPGLWDDPYATVAVLSLQSRDGRALENAGRRLKRLQTALRLWDDAEPAL